MLQQEFVHLHLHTEYSLLDGANRVSPLISSAKNFNMPALAITDHGNLFGAIEFYQKAKKGGVKPIIGCEAYLAPRSRFDKQGHGANSDDYNTAIASNPYYHLILLASNLTGYKNLMKLVSLANLEGFYYKPRIDKEILEQHAEGLIGLSGCLRGEIPYLLARDMEKEAYDAADDYQRIFGKENFFIEIQDNGLDLQVNVNRKLVDLAGKKSIRIVATNDCHYLHKEDAHAHDIMLCLQTGKTVNMPNRMRFETKELYLKSGEEMAKAFSEIPHSITNTLRIADMVDLDLTFGKAHMPNYQPPAGMTLEAYLGELSEKGLTQRLQQLNGSAASQRPLYETRLKYELDIINQMGYPGYFLIVWDIINYARQSRIPVGPGRGSAAGSLVAYALRITDIDPISNGLIFERFLNPERVSLPDIDMDFCMDRREEVMRYVTQKYGQDHVCQIITFGTMAAKGALRDVGRVLEVPYADVDRLAKLVPNTLNITLDEALAQEPKFEEEKRNNPKIIELIDLAKQLEGLSRHASTHAAGVVISNGPLTDHVPLYRGSKGETVTQYPMGDIEKIGLIKFDFLGLRTLTVIDMALKMINKKRADTGTGEIALEASAIPLNNSETYQLLGSGETTGIFQLESPGMRDLLTKMQPENFADVTAILALYRPGPIGSGMVDDFIKRKQGKKKIKYDHPKLADILKETYGVIVYQEQVMKIANVMAGFSLGEADLLRRAMGKKKVEEMAAQKVLFIERAVALKVTAAKAEKVFDLMEYFAGYGFNKSHSAAYALITFQTAYLKHHHPAEFMAALLSCEMGNSDKVVNYITECRRMDIKILPPDVNESEKGFTVVPGGIRFGLAAIKNVGGAAVDSILEVRAESGHFSTLFDFCRKIDLRRTNKRVIEALIKCGAFDASKAKRSALTEVMEQAMALALLHKKEIDSGQLSIFGGGTSSEPLDPPLPEIKEWDDQEIAKLEKEAIGFYITTHPLSPYEDLMKKRSVTKSDALSAVTDDREVRICGMVIQKRVATTKRGDKMAYLRIEDLVGSVEVIVFPELYRSSASLFDQDVPLLITGTLDQGDRGLKLKATIVLPLEKKKMLTILLLETQVIPGDIPRLKTLLEQFTGNLPVFLKIRLADSTRFTTESTIALDSRLKVDSSDELKTELRKMFGQDAAVFEGC
ncbi:MAG: DNA polymerase III subunit alpha [Nitrospirae bacterium]|nr:DNA polymerase III subunit alpha [Candidatus Manganitrophaceae bacterium]